MGLSTNYKNKIVNALVGRQNFSSSGDCWIGLATAEPTESGTTVTTHELELGSGGSGASAGYNTTTGYQRVLLSDSSYSNSQKMSLAENGASHNTAQVLFNRAITSWGKVTHVLFFSSATGSDIYGWAPIRNGGVTINADDVPNFNINAIQLSLIDTTGA